MIGPDDRALVGDLVMSTLEAAQRRNPQAVYKPGKVIVNDTNSVKGIAVQLDDSASVLYPDNVTGQPLLQNERVMVMIGANTALIVGRWVAPHIPHSTLVASIPSSGSRSATTFADFPGIPSMSFTKYRTDTKLNLDVGVNAIYANPSPVLGHFAILVNGVDYVVCLEDFSVALERQSTAGFNEIAAGVVPAGSYTCKLRWKAVLGGGTLNCDGESYCSYRITEVGI